MSEKYTIDNAKNDIQNLQSQNLFDFQEIKRLERELIKVNDELHLHLRIYKNKQLSDNKEFTEIKEDYNNLFNIIGNAILNINTIEADINTIKGNNNIYQTDIATLRTNINQLQNNLTNINSMIANLQSVDTNINSRLNQVINTAIPNINGVINNLEQIVNANSQDILDLNNRVTNLENNQDNTVATNLLTTVGNIRDRLNVAENDITNNKNKITDILTDINTLQNELNSFDTRLIAVEGIVLGNLTTRLHLYEVNLQRFDEELDQAQTDIEILYHLIEQGGVGGGTGTGTGVTPELLQRLNNIEQSIVDTNIRIDNLQLTNIEQEVQAIRNTVTTLQEQTNNLADDVEELADKVLNMDLSIMEDRITANENNITDLNTRVFTLESDNVQNKQDIVDINNRIDNLDIPEDVDLTDIENRITTNENSIIDLQEQIDNLDIPDITDLENRVTTNEADITGLQEQIDNLDIPEDVDLSEVNDRLSKLEVKRVYNSIEELNANKSLSLSLTNGEDNTIKIIKALSPVEMFEDYFVNDTNSNRFGIDTLTYGEDIAVLSIIKYNKNTAMVRAFMLNGKLLVRRYVNGVLGTWNCDGTNINNRLSEIENRLNNLPDGGTGGVSPDGTTLEDLLKTNNHIINYVNNAQNFKVYERYERVIITSSISSGSSVCGGLVIPSGAKIIYATLYTGNNTSKPVNYSMSNNHCTFTAKESIGTGTFYLYYRFVV